VQVCARCTTRFALGLASCPHCRSTDWYDEGDVREVGVVAPKLTGEGFSGPTQAKPAPAPDPAPAPEPVEVPVAAVSTSTIREWARENGHPVPARGKLPTDVIKAYIAARQQ
jgi:hypothetical protein